MPYGVLGNSRGTGGAETSTGDEAQPQVRRQRPRRITRRCARTSISRSDDSSAPFAV